jgi:hypothetical protein
MTTPPKISLPKAVSDALASFDEIASNRFEVNFEALVTDPDRNRVAARMRFMVGVIFKKEFSDGSPVRNRRGELLDYKWSINPVLLETTPTNAWSILLRSPDRKAGESGKDVALRLSRETLLQRTYFEIVHPYLCQDPQLRRQIKAILKESGLGEFADLSSPKGLLKSGAAALFVLLTPQITALPAAAIAVTALTLSVIGLDRICRNTGSRRRAASSQSRSHLSPKSQGVRE